MKRKVLGAMGGAALGLAAAGCDAPPVSVDHEVQPAGSSRLQEATAVQKETAEQYKEASIEFKDGLLRYGSTVQITVFVDTNNDADWYPVHESLIREDGAVRIIQLAGTDRYAASRYEDEMPEHTPLQMKISIPANTTEYQVEVKGDFLQPDGSYKTGYRTINAQAFADGTATFDQLSPQGEAAPVRHIETVRERVRPEVATVSEEVGFDFAGVQGVDQVLGYQDRDGTAKVSVLDPLTPGETVLVILTKYDRSSRLVGKEGKRFLPALEARNPGIGDFLATREGFADSFVALEATASSDGSLNFGIPESSGKFRMTIVRRTGAGYTTVPAAKVDVVNNGS